MAAATEARDYVEEIQKLLDATRTDKFFIEYQGFLTNHISHGISALEMLGAPLVTVKNFIERTRKKLESAESHKKRESEEEPKTDSLEELLGARRSYYLLYDHYVKLLNDKYSNQLDALVSGEFTKLSRGMVGAALHGMIHLGYGFYSGLPWFVCEGLAYLHYNYTPLCLSKSCPDLGSFGRGDADILDVLDEIRNDTELITYMKATTSRDEWINKNIGEFQPKTTVLFTDRADVLARYAHKVKFPGDIGQSAPFNVEDVPVLLVWMVDCAIITYAIAETPSDFFLIHGVTSAWALRNVLMCISDVDHVLDAVRTFICALFATYLAQQCPLLQRELLGNNPGKSYQWIDIVNRAIGTEACGDEHIYKLVQVCRRMAEESTDESMDAIYKLAGYNCTTNPMEF